MTIPLDNGLTSTSIVDFAMSTFVTVTRSAGSQTMMSRNAWLTAAIRSADWELSSVPPCVLMVPVAPDVGEIRRLGSDNGQTGRRHHRV